MNKRKYRCSKKYSLSGPTATSEIESGALKRIGTKSKRRMSESFCLKGVTGSSFNDNLKCKIDVLKFTEDEKKSGASEDRTFKCKF